MMNYCAVQQRDVSSKMTGRETVVCPKPVRVGVLQSVVADPIGAFRLDLSHHTEVPESAAGADLLDILLKPVDDECKRSYRESLNFKFNLNNPGNKGGSRDMEPFCTELDSSPPFFSGSPPHRVSNPLIQDSRFREEKNVCQGVSQLQFPITGTSSPSAYARKGGYARPTFGNNPIVRVEGFACMNRDGRNSAVSARA